MSCRGKEVMGFACGFCKLLAKLANCGFSEGYYVCNMLYELTSEDVSRVTKLKLDCMSKMLGNLGQNNSQVTTLRSTSITGHPRAYKNEITFRQI